MPRRDWHYSTNHLALFDEGQGPNRHYSTKAIKNGVIRTHVPNGLRRRMPNLVLALFVFDEFLGLFDEFVALFDEGQ